MRKVITYGTFDLFHMGHLRLLERLRALGDHLTVAVSSDAFNLAKGKTATVCYEERAHILRALRCVDEVIAEEAWDQKIDDIRRLAIQVFGMGSDWDGRFDDLKSLCEVIYLPRTEGISTTLIKESIASPTPVRVAASR